jgi:hypothetical protein
MVDNEIAGTIHRTKSKENYSNHEKGINDNLVERDVAIRSI